MTALLALISAVFIGGADFVGGITSRTANGIRVGAYVALVGLPMALAVSLVGDYEHVSRADVGWSVAAGVSVALGIGCFYIGMARGLISVVAPVAAVIGAVIPVVYALARGERPGPIALVGLVIAFFAVAVVSLAPSEQHPDAAIVDGVVLGLALASGVLFGLFYVAFSRVSDDAGLWPVTIERAAASVVLVVAALALTRGPVTGLRRMLPAVAPDRAARGGRGRAAPARPAARAGRDRVGRCVALSRHDRAARRLRAAGAALAAPVRRRRVRARLGRARLVGLRPAASSRTTRVLPGSPFASSRSLVPALAVTLRCSVPSARVR